MIDLSDFHFLYQFLQSLSFGCSFDQSHRTIDHEVSYSALCSVFIKRVANFRIYAKTEIVTKTIVDGGCSWTFFCSDCFILTIFINFLKSTILI